MNKRLTNIGSIISLRDDLSDVIDDYFAMKTEIKDLRKARDILREVEWWLSERKDPFPESIKGDIRRYFNHDSEREV